MELTSFEKDVIFSWLKTIKKSIPIIIENSKKQLELSQKQLEMLQKLLEMLEKE